MSRTKETLEGLIAQLTGNHGDLYAACRAQAVSPMFVAQWRKDDKEIDEQLTEAERVGAMQLESIAIRFATDGIEEDVYYQGEVVGISKKPSVPLLNTLLKAKIDKFGKADAAAPSQVFNGPTQINLMPRASSYEEWLAMKNASQANKSLPSPITEAVDAEFSILPPSPQFIGLDL